MAAEERSPQDIAGEEEGAQTADPTMGQRPSRARLTELAGAERESPAEDSLPPGEEELDATEAEGPREPYGDSIEAVDEDREEEAA